MAGVLSLNGAFTYPIELLKTLTVDDSATFKKSITIGENSIVGSNVVAIAYGNQSTANGSYSTAVGNESTASALYSIAVGYKTISSGNYSIALGASTNASHNNSFVWSGVESETKYQSKGNGTFCIKPSGTHPEDGFYIGNSSIKSIIESYAKAYVDSTLNTFTEKCTFTGGVESSTGDFSITSGTLTTNSSVESTFNGNTYVVTQDTKNNSELVASTKFVHNNIDRCVQKNGDTMTGYLTLHANPSENMHAATKKYVDDKSSDVTVNNSSQPKGSEIATITVDGNETKIYSPKITAGKNITVTSNSIDGSVAIHCNPEISISGGTIKVPIGTIIPYVGNGVPDGFLFCDGIAISRTDYSELFAAIGTSFGIGNGVTTFNIPNLSDNRFVEGYTTNGIYKNAGAPNITGFVGEVLHGNSSSGALYNSGYIGRRTYPSGEFTSTYVSFDASRSNSIYGGAQTIQPKSVTAKYFIKYTKTSEEKSVLMVNNVEPDSQGNVNIDSIALSNDMVEQIIKSGENPTDIGTAGYGFTIAHDGILIILVTASTNTSTDQVSFYRGIDETGIKIAYFDCGNSSDACFSINVKKGTNIFTKRDGSSGQGIPHVTIKLLYK